MESSVYQARWLLTPIFVLCICVFGVGIIFA